MRAFHDPRTLQHRVPQGFPERVERVAAVVDGLARDDRFDLVTCAGAIDEERLLAAITAVHEPAYVERFRRAVARGDGLVDSADNPVSTGTFTATLAATAVALRALDESLATRAPTLAVIRPPGHHAENAQAMGFCFLNHAAIVADQARRVHGVSRVAIIDFDVHHGNGTQHLFEERADVFYCSLHQYPFYPGTGAHAERGRGAGEGFTLNLPLDAGGGDAEWTAALRDNALPEIERFAPDLLVVSAGFDAWRDDPLGGMRVSAEGFAAFGTEIWSLAGRCASGRAVALLEGGYDLAALPGLVRAFAVGSAGAES